MSEFSVECDSTDSTSTPACVPLQGIAGALYKLSKQNHDATHFLSSLFGSFFMSCNSNNLSRIFRCPKLGHLNFGVNGVVIYSLSHFH